MTFEQIKELIELVSLRNLQGLEVERSGFRLKIDGQAPPTQVVVAASEASAPPAASYAPALPQGGSAAPAAAAPAAAEAAGPPAGSHLLTSPLVGTFYRSPSPDAAPFADVGSRVKKGQVLCIVEAMKLMNEIESDVDGVIVEIYPKNAQAVEYGETLFAIRQD